jgi:Cdc6-like AAA superfamily ATPase
MPNLIMHQRFQQQALRLRHAIERPGSGRIVFLIGPTGAGKTTMRHTVMRSVVGSPEHWGTGKIPVVEVLAMLPNGAYFSSRALVESLLRELFVPDLGWLCPPGDVESPALRQIREEIAESRVRWQECPHPQISETRSWEALLTMPQHRSLQWIIIDQAAALCTNHRNTDPADHILNLMSVAEKANINILLSGVQSAAALWAERPEIRRRSDIIWVPPYSYLRKEDRDPYLQLLRTLGSKYKYSKRTLLFDMAADLVAASAGIFGILQKILEDASIKATCAGHDQITKSDVEDSFYGARDMAKLHQDVAEFEQVMKAGSTKEQAAVIAERWNLPKARVKVAIGNDEPIESETSVASGGEEE